MSFALFGTLKLDCNSTVLPPPLQKIIDYVNVATENSIWNDRNSDVNKNHSSSHHYQQEIISAVESIDLTEKRRDASDAIATIGLAEPPGNDAIADSGMTTTPEFSSILSTALFEQINDDVLQQMLPCWPMDHSQRDDDHLKSDVVKSSRRNEIANGRITKELLKVIATEKLIVLFF